MKQDDIPKVDSVNISTRVDEVDYFQTIESIRNRSEQGIVVLPADMWPRLLPILEFHVAQFIHYN